MNGAKFLADVIDGVVFEDGVKKLCRLSRASYTTLVISPSRNASGCAGVRYSDGIGLGERVSRRVR